MAKPKKTSELENQLLEIGGKIRVFHANLQTEVAKLGVANKLRDSDLAAAFKFTPNQIQKWEGGKTDVPARYLLALHQAEQSIDEFFDSGKVTIPHEKLEELFSAQDLKNKRSLDDEEIAGHGKKLAIRSGISGFSEKLDAVPTGEVQKKDDGVAKPRRAKKR